MTQEILNPPLTVFISYSWDSDDHKKWVRKLAEELQKSGVRTYIDQWYLLPGEDKVLFMNRINDVDYILMVCTPNYIEKADELKNGVGEEQGIIIGKKLYNARGTKIIPIVKEIFSGKNPLPAYFSTKVYLDFTDEGKYEIEFENLLRAIYKKPRHVPPQLGEVPTLISTVTSRDDELRGLYQHLTNRTLTEVDILDRLVNWARINNIELPDTLLAEFNGHYGYKIEYPPSRVISVVQIKARFPRLFDDDFWRKLQDLGVNIPIRKSLGELSILFENHNHVQFDLSLYFGGLIESIREDGESVIGSIPSPLWLKIPEFRYKEISRYVNRLMVDFIINYFKKVT